VRSLRTTTELNSYLKALPQIHQAAELTRTVTTKDAPVGNITCGEFCADSEVMPDREDGVTPLQLGIAMSLRLVGSSGANSSNCFSRVCHELPTV
jgi:hypothetical protein